MAFASVQSWDRKSETRCRLSSDPFWLCSSGRHAAIAPGQSAARCDGLRLSIRRSNSSAKPLSRGGGVPDDELGFLRLGDADERQRLRPRSPRAFGHDLPHDVLGGGEHGRVAAALLLHRAGVVEQHDVIRLLPLQQGHLAGIQQRPGDERDDRRHRQDAEQQQQQLLDQQPPAVLLLAGQQKLHRRPLHPPVPHPVDEVNDDGDADEQRRRQNERRIGKQTAKPSARQTGKPAHM